MPHIMRLVNIFPIYLVYMHSNKRVGFRFLESFQIPSGFESGT